MRWSGPVVVAALVSLAIVPAAHALPAFARRFNLACGACHIAVPRLNAFGEEFHMTGFKPPGTMWAPLPGSWTDRIRDTLAVRAGGEDLDHAAFGHRPHPRGGVA